MTSKQRSKLKALASTEKPVTQIGKEGLSENLLLSLSEALEKRELIKVNILPTAGEDVTNLAANVAELLNAELVCVIGRKAVFYRRSVRKDIEHIEL